MWIFEKIHSIGIKSNCHSFYIGFHLVYCTLSGHCGSNTKTYWSMERNKFEVSERQSLEKRLILKFLRFLLS